MGLLGMVGQITSLLRQLPSLIGAVGQVAEDLAQDIEAAIKTLESILQGNDLEELLGAPFNVYFTAVISLFQLILSSYSAIAIKGLNDTLNEVNIAVSDSLSVVMTLFNDMIQVIVNTIRLAVQDIQLAANSHTGKELLDIANSLGSVLSQVGDFFASKASVLMNQILPKINLLTNGVDSDILSVSDDIKSLSSSIQNKIDTLSTDIKSRSENAISGLRRDFSTLSIPSVPNPLDGVRALEGDVQDEVDKFASAGDAAVMKVKKELTSQINSGKQAVEMTADVIIGGIAITAVVAVIVIVKKILE